VVIFGYQKRKKLGNVLNVNQFGGIKMQTKLNKRYNYGILKPAMKIDDSRINMDYLAGIVYTDGCIYYKTKKTKHCLHIIQDNSQFLKSIQTFFLNNNIQSKVYKFNVVTNNEFIVNFFRNYNFELSTNKLSFLAGMIDGDGCFCSHKSQNRGYWRFLFGTKKQREITRFEEAIKWLNIPYIKRYKRDDIISFEIMKSQELIKLIQQDLQMNVLNII